MAAYFIVDVNVHDPAGMREYLERVPATLTKYGGRYIVRGGRFEIVEGNWQPSRAVMLDIAKYGASQALVRVRRIRGHEGCEVQSGDHGCGAGRRSVGWVLTAFAGDASV